MRPEEEARIWTMIYKRIKRIAMAHRKVVRDRKEEAIRGLRKKVSGGHSEKRGKGGKQWSSILLYYIHI
jgi:hypothetical protein